MPKALRALALMTLLAASLSVVPKTEAQFIPLCFDLPDCNFPAYGWTYRHQCMKDNVVRYVYQHESNPDEIWCLYGPILP